MGAIAAGGAPRRGRAEAPRIVLAEPDAGPGARSPLAEALASIGSGGPETARVDSVAGLGAWLERSGAGRVDLVVVDDALGREAEEIVARLRRAATPAIVLQRSASAAAALAWFRRGAAECVTADRDLSALRQAALEQLERLRALRADSRERGEAGSGAEGILRQLGSGLVLVDAAGRIAFANPAAEQILGTPQERLLGRPFGECLADEPGDAHQAARRSGARNLETRVRRPNGQLLPIGLSWGPIRAEDGAPRGAVAVIQDLSDAQEWRAQALQTEKMASIGQLAAGVAHEINNPMGFIHANLFQMSEYIADLRQVWTRVEGLLKAVGSGERATLERAASELHELAEELDVGFVLQDLAKAVRESQEGSERIRHIVQDLRDFSHQDTGERVLADINQCLDSTANIVWPMMKHLVVLEKNYADLPPVPCYPMQLKQVFMNLLVNAYQAIEEATGGRGTGRIVLSTARHAEGVTVEVADTGAGIPPEHVDRIFDPFFTTKKVGDGTGLGLSTSFNIVRRHQGSLTVESAPGRGTRFRIRLPLLREDLGSEDA